MVIYCMGYVHVYAGINRPYRLRADNTVYLLLNASPMNWLVIFQDDDE